MDLWQPVNMLLLLANVAAAVFAVRRRCLRPDGLEVNHVLTFAAGFLIYWILPIGVGMAGLMRDDPAMRLWYAVFDPVPADTIAAYLSITLAVFAAFIGGDALGQRLGAIHARPYQRIFFYRRLLDFPLCAGILLAAIYTYILRDQLFRGYNLLDPAQAQDMNRGSFTSVSLFLLGTALIYTLKRQEDSQEDVGFGRLIRNRHMAVYAICALLVLSLGGRLYALSSGVMLLTYATGYFRRLPLRRAGMLFVAALVVFGVTGVVRQSSDFTERKFLITTMTEPMFTGFSLIYFLGHHGFEPLKFPVFLMSQFLNLVPTALWPDKLAMTLNPEDFGYVTFAPAGALSSFFSFMVNFGVLGTLLAMGAFGALMGYLRTRDASLLHRAFTIMLTGWIGFTFFRDPFFVSIVKTMFEFSFLVPLLLVIAVQMLSIALRSTLPRVHPQPAGGVR